MIVIHLAGGLGNQLFQYAFGRAAALKRSTDLIYDISYFNTPAKNGINRSFNLEYFETKGRKMSSFESKYYLGNGNNFLDNIYFKIKRKFYPVPYITETDFHYNAEFMDILDNSFIEGYFQSERYFKHIENIIRQDLIFKEPILSFSEELLKKINDTNSVCVFVRRAEFVTNPKINKIHGFCKNDYYNKAVERINESVKDPFYFIFSDDVLWCKENCHYGENQLIVSHEHAGKDFINYFHLMTMCKYFIISNSTFGWWSAWLGSFKDKIIIAPSRWFNDTSIDTNDLFPDEWILL